MRKITAIIFGKITLLVSKFLKLGAGGTWPGEIALKIYPQLISDLTNQMNKGIIIIAGTNGKTTTSLMINQILNQTGFKTIHNATGANLLNGIASVLIQNSSWTGGINADYGVFEVDENSLPAAIFNLQFSIYNEKKKNILVILNLFRDQLDRYGEVDVIAEKWEQALKALWSDSGNQYIKLILNSDDPLIAHLGKVVKNSESRSIVYFGIDEPKQFIPKMEHTTDSIFCLNCGGRLDYKGIYFSHLGIWKCEQCGQKRPQPDISNFPSTLPGLYNKYNTLAAVSVGKALNIDKKIIKQALQDFTPAFGRQEEFKVDGPTSPPGLRGASKKIKLFLSKNPAGFNASLRTILELINQSHPRPDRGSHSNKDSRVRGNDNVLLLVLNDRIPDGRDVSWIWDVDFETIPENMDVIVSGDRVYDLALRIKYAQKVYKVSKAHKVKSLKIEPDLKKAIHEGLKMIKSNETFYILPTYSAMLETRKILSGRKIL